MTNEDIIRELSEQIQDIKDMLNSHYEQEDDL